MRHRLHHLSASPTLEYTVATGWTGGLASGGAFLKESLSLATLQALAWGLPVIAVNAGALKPANRACA